MPHRKLITILALVSAAVLLTATGVATASNDNPQMKVISVPEVYPGTQLTVQGDGCGTFDGDTNHAASQQVTAELYPASGDSGAPLASKAVDVPQSGDWQLQLIIPTDVTPGQYVVEAVCVWTHPTDETTANALPQPGKNQSSFVYGKIGVTVYAPCCVASSTSAPTTSTPPATPVKPAPPARPTAAQPTFTG